MQKMIMIPEWRYNKMVESYDKALAELESLREQLEVAGIETTAIIKGGEKNGKD